MKRMASVAPPREWRNRVIAALFTPSLSEVHEVAADVAAAERFIGGMDPVAQRVAERRWPGALTLVLAGTAPRARTHRGTEQCAVDRTRLGRCGHHGILVSDEPGADGVSDADGAARVRVARASGVI